MTGGYSNKREYNLANLGINSVTIFNSSNCKNNKYFSFSSWAIPIGLSALLVIISFNNFLLFHTLAEFFSITIAILTFVVAWSMYPFTRNNYLMFLGVGYFWIGILDLLHAMAYKGMQVMDGGGANMAVQYWIGTRYLEALLLLSAPWFLSHELKRNRCFIIFAIIATVITLLVYLQLFPVGYVPGKGLTEFKVYSEYAIIFLLILAIYYLYRQRKLLEQQIINVLIVSILFTIGAELAFTFYVDVYGLSNLTGHILKIFSFWLIFQAIVRTTLQEPFLVMSRGATTYDVIPDAAIVVDEKGIIRNANKKAYELANQSAGTLIGQNNHDTFHPKSLNIEHCPVCQAIVNNEEINALELKFDDKKRWLDFSLSHIKGASELNGTVEVIRDITGRKLTEEKVKELDILKKSIVENLPSVLFVKDAVTHRYIEWNKAAEELTGLLKEDMLGNTDYDFWPKEQAQFFIDKDDETARNDVIVDIAEEPITTKFKGVRTLHTRKIPIKDDDGKAKYLLGISEDITDLLDTQKMLSRSQKMEVVGQMSGGIAHDFNNQLGIILGYTELLLEHDVEPSQLAWLKAVKTAAERCAELTRQLLVFSRSGEGDKCRVDVSAVITDMKDMISKVLTPAINVQYYLNEDLWKTEVNKGACQDALLNLIINARDAMKGGGTLTVETANIRLEEASFRLVNLEPGEYVKIMISDTGEGMNEEVREHVFEPFYTTKEVGEGTGLGLSMVYGFVKGSGGDLTLETEVGKGSTFRLYLPRSTANNEALLSNKEINTDQFLRGSENILVVDDEEALLNFIEHVLKSWGYNVYRAANAEAALHILNNLKIDLLFSDVVMPGDMNGYELAEKSLVINPSIKVLLTSGFSGKNAKVNLHDKYHFEKISKPYDRLELSIKLRELLDK